MTPFQVIWKLTSACTLACPHCSEPARDADCIYVKDRLLTMAGKILEKRRPAYAITFGGGEPGLHPFLPDLTRYFLREAPNANVIIQSSGGLESSFYNSLMHGLYAGALTFSLAIHPGISPLPKILDLATAIADAGQKVHFRLLTNNAQSERVTRIYKSLCAFRSITPFTFEWLPLGGAEKRGNPFPRLTEAEKAASPITQATDTSSSAAHEFSGGEELELVFLDEEEIVEPEPVIGNVTQPFPDATQGQLWWCPGATLLHIGPDGKYRYSCLEKKASPLPLWHPDAVLKNNVIEKWSLAGASDTDSSPKFDSENEARTWLDKLTDERLLWEHTAVRKKGIDSHLEKVRARLKRLLPTRSGGANPELTPQHDAAWRNMERIAAIHERLVGEASKRTLLRIIRAIESGDAGFLGSAQTPELSGHGSTGDALRFDGIQTRAALQPHAAEIRRRLPDLKMRLSWDAQEFLDTLDWLTAEFTRHDFRLYFDGSQPALEARSLESFPEDLLPDRRGEQSEAISVIAVCRDDQDAIGPLIDSVLAQGMENIELIIVDNGSRDNSARIIEGRSQTMPGKIHFRRLEKPVGNGAALRMGMELARGSAMLFLEPGAILCPGFLESAFAVLSNDDVEIVAGPTARVAGESIAYASLESADLEAMPDGFLNACARGFSFSACMLEADFLRANHLTPYPDDVNAILALGCAVFAAAKNVQRVSAPAVVIRNQERFPQSGESLACFGRSLAFLEQFYADHGLPADASGRSGYERQLYRECREHLLQDIRAQKECSKSSRELEQICCRPDVIAEILGDYARAYCRKMRIAPAGLPGERDWQDTAKKMRQKLPFRSSGPEETDLDQAPLFSIIVVNNGDAEEALRTIESTLEQPFGELEAILITNPMREAELSALLDYADFEPRLTIVETPFQASGPILRRAGMEAARGKYVIFTDAGDKLEEDFLQRAVEALADSDAPFGIFSSRRLSIDNTWQWSEKVRDGVAPAAGLWQDWLEGGGRSHVAVLSRSHGLEVCSGDSLSDPVLAMLAEAANSGAMIPCHSISALIRHDSEKTYGRPAPPSYAEAKSALWLCRLMTRNSRKRIPLSREIRNALLPALAYFEATDPGFSISRQFGEDFDRDTAGALLYSFAEECSPRHLAPLESEVGRKRPISQALVSDKEDIVACASIRFPYLDPDGSGQHELSDFALAASASLDWDEVMHGCAVLRNRPEFDFIYFYGKEASFCGAAACGGRELLGAMVSGHASLDPGKFLFRRSALPEGLKDASHYLALLRILNSDAKGFLLEASFRKKLAKRRAEGARSWPEIFGAIRDLTSWLEEENLASCISPVLSAVIRKENLSALLGESCLDLDQVVRDVESVPALLTVMREKSQGAVRRREASDTHDVIMDFIRARAV